MIRLIVCGVVAVALLSPGQPPRAAVGADDGAWINVRSVGAVGDGRADDTAAFERAIELSRDRLQPVYVPRGRYRLTRTLRLQGQLMIGQFAGGWPADSMPMPTLLIDHIEGPGLQMGGFSSLHGIAIMYPEETAFPNEGGPPAVSLTGQGPSITSTRIQYPYDGITTSPRGTPGRARLSDIFIVSPKHDGVHLTKSYDVSQLRNIEVWCNLGMSTGAGFRFGRNDDGAFSDLFAFKCRIGFLFETDREDGGGDFYGSLVNCSTDACAQGYVVRGNHRLNITGSDLINHNASLEIDGEGASVRVTGCHVQSNGAPSVQVTRAANLAISNSWFTRAFNTDFYFVRAQNCGSLTISDCQFKPNGPGVYLGAGVKRAVVTDNIFEAATDALVDRMSPDAKRILEPNLRG